MSRIYPKMRLGHECKKINCIRYGHYKAWRPGNDALKFCMECKHAHVSQFESLSKQMMSK